MCFGVVVYVGVLKRVEAGLKPVDVGVGLNVDVETVDVGQKDQQADLQMKVVGVVVVVGVSHKWIVGVGHCVEVGVGLVGYD